jgi:hypothetical protein
MIEHIVFYPFMPKYKKAAQPSLSDKNGISPLLPTMALPNRFKGS